MQKLQVLIQETSPTPSVSWINKDTKIFKIEGRGLRLSAEWGLYKNPEKYGQDNLKKYDDFR